jgi:hypothetical protein
MCIAFVSHIDTVYLPPTQKPPHFEIRCENPDAVLYSGSRRPKGKKDVKGGFKRN